MTDTAACAHEQAQSASRNRVSNLPIREVVFGGRHARGGGRRKSARGRDPPMLVRGTAVESNTKRGECHG